MVGMPKLPSLNAGAGRIRARRTRAVVDCSCGGCGATTTRTWASGHDGYCTGWAIRVERGVVALSQVPDSVVQGVVRVLGSRAAAVEAAELAIANVPNTNADTDAIDTAAGEGMVAADLERVA